MDEPELQPIDYFQKMDDPDFQQTSQFLWISATKLATTCPAASRYYMSTLTRHIGNSMLNQLFVKLYRCCNHCGSLLNHKIQIRPIPPPNRHIKKLLKWEKEQPWKLNRRQTKNLKKYRKSTNTIIFTCKVCKKTKSFDGLKKYKAKALEIINTPVQKFKSKKGDLNAGLFIRTSKKVEKQIELKNDIQDDKCQNEVSIQASLTPELMDSSTPNNEPQATKTAHAASEIMKKKVTSSNKKKKKKGLLAQILNQEQEAKLQKKTLSSFLTAL